MKPFSFSSVDRPLDFDALLTPHEAAFWLSGPHAPDFVVLLKQTLTADRETLRTLYLQQSHAQGVKALALLHDQLFSLQRLGTLTECAYHRLLSLFVTMCNERVTSDEEDASLFGTA